MIRGGRGHPALELTRPGGSSLLVATDGTRCALVWINTLEESFHSTGGGPGPVLVYDYNGSWSEAPADWAIPVAAALGCARNFILHGTPELNRSFSGQTYQLRVLREAVPQHEPHADPPNWMPR